MASFVRQLLAVDRERLDLRAGVLGLAVLALFGAVVALTGLAAIAAAVGALVVLTTDPPRSGRSWLASLLPVALAGVVLTYVAVLIGGQAVPAALLAAVVGSTATLHAGHSSLAEARSLVASIWVIVALTLTDTGVGALEYAAAFGMGAAAGAAVAWWRARGGAAHEPPADGDDVPEAVTPLGELLRSSLGLFALLRGAGLAVAVLLGFTYFPAHPAWAALTCLIVMRPPVRQALVVGLQRSLGTGLGVVLAVALAGVVGDSTPGLVALFLASAFLMMAVREVNYALFAMAVASLVVYLQRILGADAAESGRDRVVETVLGVAIALAVLGITEAVARDEPAGA